ncbi:MAG TPA: hypothetical protein VEL10_09705 [Gaiellaceae bacterium]|nr:hypothetical protein [Gaiellaceae bacterium]
MFFGVSIDRPSETLDGFERAAGKRVALMNSYVSLASTQLDTAGADAVWSAWIRDFLAQLGRNRSVVGFVWFQYDKETDWRIDSSSASRVAFGAGLAHPRYVGAFSLTG